MGALYKIYSSSQHTKASGVFKILINKYKTGCLNTPVIDCHNHVLGIAYGKVLASYDGLYAQIRWADDSEKEYQYITSTLSVNEHNEVYIDSIIYEDTEGRCEEVWLPF